MRLIIVFLVILLALVHSSPDNPTSSPDPLCPDWVFDPTWTMGEVILNNLLQEGPPDGECSSPNQNKWIYDGKPYGLPDKCACDNFPAGEGEYRSNRIEKSFSFFK